MVVECPRDALAAPKEFQSLLPLGGAILGLQSPELGLVVERRDKIL